jgi:endonuclease/exonuclease/phosphatase (EEP) superfamily protein YafD
MSVNLLNRNTRHDAVARLVLAEQPDLVAFQEYTESWHAHLFQALGGRYPYVLHETREDSFGAALYSRLPIERGETRVPIGHTELQGAGRVEVPALRAELVHGGRRIAFYNIHLLPPDTPAYLRVQQRQYGDLARLLPRERGPVLVMGDFNWTQFSRCHAGMKALGLEEGHAQAGAGTGNTWPSDGLRRFLPGVRIDHLYLGGGLCCVEHRTGPRVGSDHLPLIARVGFR